MNYKDLPIGIDLGTTNSCIGVYRNGSVEILANQISGRTTPSVVSFCGNEISIGEQTQNQIFKEPEKVIYSVKRILGKKFTDPGFNKLIYNLAYKNKIKNSGKEDRPIINVEFKGENRQYFPEEISAMVLKRLKENAENSLGHEIKKAVITIPAYFTESQREATKIAAEGAGIEVIKIINEPTAAALAYGLKDKNDLMYAEEDSIINFEKNTKKEEEFDEKTILVFDLGGGTFDVTCLKIKMEDDEPQFDILGHSGNVLIGGDDFDNLLVEHCIQIFRNEYKIDINTRNENDIKARKRLKIACERAKKILSYETQANINIESLYDDKDFQYTITRARFENLCKKKFNELIQPIEKALEVSELEKNDIEEVVFVGGSSRIPKVEEIVRNYFGNKIKICKSINPDEIVAYGATLQAAICLRVDKVSNVLINDICSHSLGIMVDRGEGHHDDFFEMIKNGTNIPYEVEKEFTTVHDEQKEVCFQIFEGENEFCRNNRLLGKFILSGISIAKKGVPKLKAKIEIDGDCIIHVNAKEELTGANNSLDIKYDKGIMSKEEITKLKEKIEKAQEYEKSKQNIKEKELVEKLKLLSDDFEKNENIKTIKEIESVQEQIADISLDKNNKNNLEKQYKEIKRLFKVYNFEFTEYFNEYKKLSDKYLIKIKKYMSSFKGADTYYLKSLVKIFKDDKYINRIANIVYICINLYIESLKTGNNKKFSAFYYNESLDLINLFREQIKKSDLKKKFEELEKLCILEREKIIIEEQTKQKSINNNNPSLKELTIEQAISAIDQYSYTIDQAGKPKCQKEKEFKAYLIAKLVHLEINYFNIVDYKKIDNMIKEALDYIDNLKEEENPWIKLLFDCKNIVDRKINENNDDHIRRLSSFNLEIDGTNDDDNIKCIEFINNDLISDDKKKGKKDESVKDLYDNDPEKLLKNCKKIVNQIPEDNTKIKEKKNWFMKNINKIYEKIKNRFKSKKKKPSKKPFNG